MRLLAALCTSLKGSTQQQDVWTTRSTQVTLDMWMCRTYQSSKVVDGLVLRGHKTKEPQPAVQPFYVAPHRITPGAAKWQRCRLCRSSILKFAKRQGCLSGNVASSRRRVPFPRANKTPATHDCTRVLDHASLDGSADHCTTMHAGKFGRATDTQRPRENAASPDDLTALDLPMTCSIRPLSRGPTCLCAIPI